MKHKTPGVTDELLLKAKEEFLAAGYQNASLRHIAEAANVSTNSIYSRFNDKAGLFDAIVKENADELYNMITEMNKVAEAGYELETTMDLSGQYTFKTLDYIYDHFDVFKLIFCRSAGTEYEHYIDRLSHDEEEAIRQYVKKGTEGNKISDLFIHVVSQAGYRDLMEIVEHDLTREEAHLFMEGVMEYRMAGWKAVIEQ